MRKTFYSELQTLIAEDSRVVALLGDIGVFSFKDSMEKFPDRVMNFGIMEQAMIGAACGLAKGGFIPFVHSIAPFVTERCYEQLKLNLGYENVNAFVVSVGNSYDYAGLGCTHHCPNDLRIVSSIPNFKTFCAGNPSDLKKIIKRYLNASGPKYIRLSEFSNNFDSIPKEKLPRVLENGNLCVIIGNGFKDFGKLFAANINCNFLYTYDVSEFQSEILATNLKQYNNKKITVIEPCYDSGILTKIALSIPNCEIHSIAIPKNFIESYGTKQEIDYSLGLDDDSIIKKLINIYGNTN